MMWGYHDFGFGGGGMGIGMLLFWGLIVAAIVVLARGLAGGAPPPAPEVRDKTPLDILRERYARGEISREEFERIKKDLS